MITIRALIFFCLLNMLTPSFAQQQGFIGEFLIKVKEEGLEKKQELTETLNIEDKFIKSETMRFETVEVSFTWILTNAEKRENALIIFETPLNSLGEKIEPEGRVYRVPVFGRNFGIDIVNEYRSYTLLVAANFRDM